MATPFGRGRLLILHIDRVAAICIGHIRDGTWLLGGIGSCEEICCWRKHLSAHASFSLQVVISVKSWSLLQIVNALIWNIIGILNVLLGVILNKQEFFFRILSLIRSLLIFECVSSWSNARRRSLKSRLNSAIQIHSRQLRWWTCDHPFRSGISTMQHEIFVHMSLLNLNFWEIGKSTVRAFHLECSCSYLDLFQTLQKLSYQRVILAFLILCATQYSQSQLISNNWIRIFV